MGKVYRKKWVVVLLIASLVISLCGGCSGLKYHNIYRAAFCGAAIGAVIGHQSDECEAGAFLGAAVFAVGDLLHQMDDLSEKRLEEAAEEVAKGNPLPTLDYGDQPY